MTWVLSALAFLLLLTLLVIIHELGHFLMARWAGVTVEEFGFGLPPRAKRMFNWKGTLFSLNWIPFGGFVRLKGENSLDPAVRSQPGSFASASIPSRLVILLAGVFMNFVLAITVFTGGFWLSHWIPTYLDLDALERGEQRQEVAVEWGLYIAEVSEGGMAERAGVTGESVLKAVNGQPVTKVDGVLALQEGKSAVQYTILFGEEFEEEQTLRVGLQDGMSGIALSEFALSVTTLDRGFLDGVRLALRETWVVTVGTIKGMGALFRSLVFKARVPEGIAGIVGIAQLTHDSVQAGLAVYLRLVALLSLSLAVLNILPFPALDGGRMMFVFFEMFTGKPVNRRLEVMTNGVGILLIMVLMIAVTWSDIARILSDAPS